jgi:hypothetical protein
MKKIESEIGYNLQSLIEVLALKPESLLTMKNTQEESEVES